MAADGSFVVVWSGRGVGDAAGVFYQRFNSVGTPVGGETRVNTTVDGGQSSPSVAVATDGSFVVAWSGIGPGDLRGVMLQRDDASGTPIGGEELVNTFTTYDQEDPSISIAPDGSSVITWTSLYQDGSQRGVFAQEFRADGSKDGGEFMVTSSTTGNQQF